MKKLLYYPAAAVYRWPVYAVILAVTIAMVAIFCVGRAWGEVVRSDAAFPSWVLALAWFAVLFAAAAACWWRASVLWLRLEGAFRPRRFERAAKVLALLGVLGALLLVSFSAWGQQTRIPGVGLPGVPPGFERRSVPERSWRGHYAEMEFVTHRALTNACRANIYGTAATHTCIPTRSEADWVIVNEPRHGNFFRTWWHELEPGGTKERAIVLSPGGLGRNVLRSIRQAAEQCGGKWQLGLFSYPGFWGDSCRGNGWPVWIDNRLPADHEINAGITATPGGQTTPPASETPACPVPWLPCPPTPEEWPHLDPRDSDVVPGVGCYTPPRKAFFGPMRRGTYTPSCKVTVTPPPAPRCGDGTCNPGETCTSCAADCGACPPPPPPPTEDCGPEWGAVDQALAAILDAVAAARQCEEGR